MIQLGFKGLKLFFSFREQCAYSSSFPFFSVTLHGYGVMDSCNLLTSL
jgi:hypothetical protein